MMMMMVDMDIRYTVDMESELGARERILEAQKNFMTVSIMVATDPL